MRPSLLFSTLLLLSVGCQRTTDRVATTPVSSTITPKIPDASLRETRWVVRQLSGKPVATPIGGQEPYLQISAAGTAEGLGGCNRFRGVQKPPVGDGELEFGPLATTRMACPATSTEQQFMQALQTTRSFRISGDTLRLYSNAERSGAPLARLEAVYLR